MPMHAAARAKGDGKGNITETLALLRKHGGVNRAVDADGANVAHAAGERGNFHLLSLTGDACYVVPSSRVCGNARCLDHSRPVRKPNTTVVGVDSMQVVLFRAALED